LLGKIYWVIGDMQKSNFLPQTSQLITLSRNFHVPDFSHIHTLKRKLHSQPLKFYMMTDIEIAQSVKPQHIRNIAAKLNIAEDQLEYYGNAKAKLPLT